MPLPHHAELQEALEALDRLTLGVYYTLEEICDHGRAVGRKTMVEVVDYAVAAAILTKAGRVHVRRRATTSEDLTALLTTQGPVDISNRLREAHEGIESLLAGRTGHLWLALDFPRMPANTRHALHTAALVGLPPDATETAVETQMLQLAARTIQNAFRPSKDHDG